MKNKLEQKLQALTGKLPEGVAATRSMTVLEGETLRTVGGGASRGGPSGGAGGSSGGAGSGGGGGSRRR